MTAERDRDQVSRDHRKVAEERLELVLRDAAEAGDEDACCEDSGLGSFLERFPAAAKERRAPD